MVTDDLRHSWLLNANVNPVSEMEISEMSAHPHLHNAFIPKQDLCYGYLNRYVVCYFACLIGLDFKFSPIYVMP